MLFCKQSGDRDKNITGVQQTIQNRAKRVRRLLVEIVTENNRAGFRLCQNIFGDFSFARLGPITGVDTPKHHAKPFLLRSAPYGGRNQSGR
jgi:hypothetical protein